MDSVILPKTNLGTGFLSMKIMLSLCKIGVPTTCMSSHAPFIDLHSRKVCIDYKILYIHVYHAASLAFEKCNAVKTSKCYDGL